MNRVTVPVRPPLRPGLVVCALAALALFGSVVWGQDLDLPVPDMTVSVTSREVTLDWPEIERNDGRATSNVTLISWDFVNSSDVEFVGTYALDCDFRLLVSKVPRENGFNRTNQLVYSIFENTGGVGAPRAVDTLEVFEPDTDYLFEPAVAGSLGMRFTTTLEQAPGPLGSVPVTIGGLMTSSSPMTGYFVTALSTGSPGSGLTVEVAGPVDINAIPNPLPPNVPKDTLSVTSAGQVFPIMNGMTISFEGGTAAPGDTAKWTEHYLFHAQATITADLQAFGGYRVWRAEIPRGSTSGVLGPLELMGEIRQCESKFTFVLLDESKADRTQIELLYDPGARHFTFHDRSVHNDFPYEYGLSTFDRGFLGNVENQTLEGEINPSGVLFPGAQSRTDSEVFVVPNPYKGSADWEEGEAKVVFSNLPSACTIRIFTSAGDHLSTLQHGPGVPGSTSPTSRNWNLTNGQGVRLSPGIYIFHVEETSGSFRQEGKLVVAR